MRTNGIISSQRCAREQNKTYPLGHEEVRGDRLQERPACRSKNRRTRAKSMQAFLLMALEILDAHKRLHHFPAKSIKTILKKNFLIKSKTAF